MVYLTGVLAGPFLLWELKRLEAVSTLGGRSQVRNRGRRPWVREISPLPPPPHQIGVSWAGEALSGWWLPALQTLLRCLMAPPGQSMFTSHHGLGQHKGIWGFSLRKDPVV